MRDLTAEADRFLAVARENLRRDGHLLPVTVILSDRGNEMVGLQFENDDEKRAAYARITARCRQLKAYALITLNESWFVEGEPAEAETGMPPSQDPRRREAIMLTIIGPGFQPRMRIVPFRRVAGHIGFEPVVEYDKATVPMVEPWWTKELPVS